MLCWDASSLISIEFNNSVFSSSLRQFLCSFVKLREDFLITYLILVYIFQVAEKLYQRASKKEPDKYNFINLASRVEEFTLRLLDPLKYDKKERQRFFNSSETEIVVETAIKFEQKKVILQNRVICSVISNLSMAIYWQHI